MAARGRQGCPGRCGAPALLVGGAPSSGCAPRRRRGRGFESRPAPARPAVTGVVGRVRVEGARWGSWAGSARSTGSCLGQCHEGGSTNSLLQ